MPRLTAQLVENFAGTFLSPRYDDPAPTPAFHREAWGLYCSDAPLCTVIAPRDHAKSTALTFDYVLAEVLFRVSDYVILLGSTEDMAAEQLSNIREELADNDALRQSFGVKGFEQDSKTDIIVRCTDGHRFRILARGAEQKIRGKMWKGKRPNLMVFDDVEDDEQVMNKDRRVKFRAWVFRAALQAISQRGKVRVHGTILHDDSWLARIIKSVKEALAKGERPSWKYLYYKAHASFDDFSAMLWPERWTEAKLRARRQAFVDDGDAPGYSQEFLNEPGDTADPYLRRDDFLPATEDDLRAQKVLGCGVDFAISKRDKANRTSFTIGGKDVQNLLTVVDQRVGRWDSLEIIEEFFLIEAAWHPTFWVEDGQIWKAISPVLTKEMQKRDRYLNIFPLPSITDKASRGRVFQKRHRAHGMRFDKSASWYPGYEDELMKFRVEAEATLDDQFDSTVELCRGFENAPEVEGDDFMSEEQFEHEYASRRLRKTVHHGRSAVTGY